MLPILEYATRYWRIGLIAAACLLAVGWCAERDARLRRQGEIRAMMQEMDALARQADALADSLVVSKNVASRKVDTLTVYVERVRRDTVQVERLATEIRQVVPDSVVAKVDSLAEAHTGALEALTLAEATIEALSTRTRQLEALNANLERRLQIATDAQTQPSRFGLGPAIFAGVDVQGRPTFGVGASVSLRLF